MQDVLNAGELTLRLLTLDVWRGTAFDQLTGLWSGNAGLCVGRAGGDPEVGFEIRAQDQGRKFGRRALEAVALHEQRADTAG